MLEHRRLADARTTADLDEAMLIEGQVKRLDRFESRKLDTGDAVAALGQSLSCPLRPFQPWYGEVPVACDLEAAVGEQPAQFDAFDEATCLRPLERDFDP